MTYYTIGKKETINYGYNDSQQEIHICPKDAYMGDMSFHPLFESEIEAQKYLDELKFNSDLKVIELSVYKK